MAMKPRAMNKKTKMMRGGTTAKKTDNVGASMKPTQKNTPKPTMMRGGMAKNKKK